MSVTTTLTRTAAALVVAVALTGCAGPAPAGQRSAAVRPTASATPTTAPSPSTPTAVASRDLRFEDGDALSASALPAFALEVSALDGWTQTGEDPSAGSREYTNAAGSVANITQQRVTDLDPTAGDRAATERMFTASGAPVERLEEQLLPTATGGTAQFLSVASQDSDGSWSATVARAFAKPGIVLVVRVRTTSQEALRPDLHDVLVAAKVVVA
ncbi:hypothetical protein GCM10009706_06560 [Curtobacterium citreum]|uniref:Lipoprotein LpqN n=1 Tax=Curtobacterium citreum TaxID=2036 RepID=A0ABT2HCU1_9MICO|nr:hypothetical protein [Curtobacterium citreum]MCS6521076.1 hypothetical protein [Curtobacterium citreum]TQJ27930.1 hypothetical protein FB462_1798 [Curtobacterium citreum]GGL70988.1 hypothetical protein GCM10009706_06560 [Curtobacterium citreum]